MMNSRYISASKFTGAISGAITVAFMAMALTAVGVMGVVILLAGPADAQSHGPNMMMQGDQRMPHSIKEMAIQGMNGHAETMPSGHMKSRDMMREGRAHRARRHYRSRRHVGRRHGDRVRPINHLSIEDVRHHFEHRLERRGNKRLKVGEVKKINDNSITADIVTLDNSLVRKMTVDRHSGRVSRDD